MHTTHDWFAGRLARDRAAEEVGRASARRLRATAGVDLHTRAVTAFGDVADRLRAGDRERRDRAAAVSRRAGLDGVVRAV